MGRADPFETASLMVIAGHLTPTEAWHAVGPPAVSPSAWPPAGPVVGAGPSCSASKGTDLVDALARAGETRTVVHAGRVVARSVVRRSLLPQPAATDGRQEESP